MSRLVYKPFSLVLGVLGGVAARAIFKRLWAEAAHEDGAPQATDAGKGWGQVIAAGAVEGAVFGGVKAVIDRAGATGFDRLTGTWPGDDSRR